MISVIVCSGNPARFAAVKAMYGAALGDEPWEMIGIHDARSMAEGYNRAVAMSRGEIVVFSHDGVEVLSRDLPGRLKGHLRRFDLLGVAGTGRLHNGRWTAAGPPHLFGQLAQLHNDGRIVIQLYGPARPVVGGIQALYGIFMAARRTVFQSLAFDAVNFDGFHLHDADFSFQAHRAGLRVGVACDINLLCHSLTDYGPVRPIDDQRFEAKWGPHLVRSRPPTCRWMAVAVRSRREALEVMNPPFWSRSEAEIGTISR